MSSSEVEAAHVPVAARSKKKNGKFARLGRHAKSFRFRSGRSAGVKEDDHNSSRCFKRCDNTKFSLDPDEIVGLRAQQASGNKNREEGKGSNLGHMLYSVPREKNGAGLQIP